MCVTLLFLTFSERTDLCEEELATPHVGGGKRLADPQFPDAAKVLGDPRPWFSAPYPSRCEGGLAEQWFFP